MELLRVFGFPTNEDISTLMDDKLKLSASEEETLTMEQMQYPASFLYRQIIGAVVFKILLITRISRSGHIVFMDNGPVVQYSKKQTNTACSSCEAKYMAMAPCIQNINYYRGIVN